MQKTIWYIKRTARMAFFAVLSLAMGAMDGRAQPPGSGIFGNEWLTGKYSQDWLRIGVYKNGIQKVTLPVNFQNKSGQLHLYHRGAEVALISASNTEIEFYGILNDGASDALLYRPYTGTRANPYFSWYSDESAYFLTFSPATSTKLAVNQVNIALSGAPESYHLQKEIKVFTEADTYDGGHNLVHHTLFPSYLKEGKGRSSKVYYKRIGDNPGGNPIFSFPFQMENLVVGTPDHPRLDVLLNGRTTSLNVIQPSVGKIASNLTNYPSLIQFSNFVPYNWGSEINPTSDLDSTGKGHFQLESKVVTDNSATTGAFSVSYIRLTYPQTFSMAGMTSAIFNLRPSNNNYSNINIPNAPSNVKVYDITDADNPRIISSNFSGSMLNLMVERVVNKELNLLVTNENNVTNKLTPVQFDNYNPSNKDYLVIATSSLYNSALTYSGYRETTNGGSYRTLTVNVLDIYNQFNYGEPSPLAIKRFVNYMLSDGIRSEHNLLLIGNAVANVDMVLNNRELPDQIPVMQYPGADALLVTDINGEKADVPAIPVGRIAAATSQQVLDYLSKVIEYEQDTSSVEWRKKVLHLTGGENSNEADRFKNFMISQSLKVTASPFLGSVTAKWKPNPGTTYENVDISSEVNLGVGFIGFLGHGTSTAVDPNMGYVSDVSRGYQNSKRYPVMSFASCGVGNIFKTLDNSLAKDWILTPQKGAIAVIGLSTYGFETSETKYIPIFYDHIFGKMQQERKSLGMIIKETGEDMYAQFINYDYDVANAIHQRILVGDPAIQILRNNINCKPTANVNDSVPQGAKDQRQAQNLLVATNTILAGAEANYHAGTEVLLLAGFEALQGSVFRGYIEPCSGSDSTSSRKGVEELAAASQENTDEPDLSVFPNPSNGLIKIGLKNIPTGTVEVFGTDGYKYVSESFYGQNEVDVNIKKEKPGLYVIRVVSGNKVYTKTIVKF